MGVIDLIKQTIQEHFHPIVPPQDGSKKLSSKEKEQIMVDRVRTVDMLQFTEMPYNLNFPVQKFYAPRSHPFAYIDLDISNQAVAKNELERINRCIIQARRTIPALSRKAIIDINKVIFEKQSEAYGYTRIMCTPYTFTKKVAKSPLNLFFMTPMGYMKPESHGTLYYGQNGAILKADVYVWENDTSKDYLTGWFFKFKTVNNELTLCEVKFQPAIQENVPPRVLYKLED